MALSLDVHQFSVYPFTMHVVNHIFLVVLFIFLVVLFIFFKDCKFIMWVMLPHNLVTTEAI